MDQSALEEAEVMDIVNQLTLMGAEHGLPRVAARILSYLMLTGRPVGRSDIRQRLQISHAGLSANTRLLVDAGLIRRTVLQGTLADGFEVPPDAWQVQLERNIARLGRKQRDIDSILERTTSAPLRALDAALKAEIETKRRMLGELAPGA